ncbi:DDE family endonuclease [Salix suchowensis]|nr:DDE family endonuclease [Salix suchowensis]
MARYLSHDTIAQYTTTSTRTVSRVLSDYRKHGTITRPPMRLELRGAKRRLSTDDLQITKAAAERNQLKRAAYLYEYGIHFTPEQTVFVDESSFDRRTASRNSAWALSGQRAHRNVFFVRGKRYSMLPALSLNGIIHVKIVEGSFTTRLFREFIEGLLDHMQPFPAPKSVIIMDNARIHKDPRIIDLIHSRGMRVLFLPPYSPDFNPIELAFSSIKSFVRRHQVLSYNAPDTEDDTYVYLHLIEAAFSIGSTHALGYYHQCGYI